jgi:hypothetical protein
MAPFGAVPCKFLARKASGRLREASGVGPVFLNLADLPDADNAPPSPSVLLLLSAFFGYAHGQPYTSVMEALQSRADCSTFTQLVAAAGLNSTLQNTSLNVTMFAPNNA